MSTLTLTRFSYAPFGTFGCMEVAGTLLYTVEQPWRLNERRRSCVPEGTYRLIKHNSRRFPNTWALINEDLGIYYQPIAGAPPDARYAILIHVANTPSDVMGCIGPGMGLGMINGTWAVTGSKNAVNLIRDVEKTTPFTQLEIRGVDLSRSVEEIPYA